MSSFRAVAIAFALLVLSAAPAWADQGSDYVSSDNVHFVKSLKLAADGVGARIVGKYMYVTSTKDLEIYDISNPEDPQLTGSVNVNVEFENEEVPTNGSLLGISGQTPTVNSAGVCPSIYPATSSGCLALYDVRDKAAPKLLTNVLGAGDHTSTCVLDCSYLYGSSGTVTDARNVLDTKQAAIVGNWFSSATIPDFNGTASGKFVRGCHNVTEIRPGILLAACQPLLLLSVNPEDGGSILAPKVLGTATNQDGRFIHGNHWPRAGADKFMLAGGEHNFQPSCTGPGEIGAFMTWDASHVGLDGKFDGPLDEWRPTNGAYLDSNPPLNQLGCSAHWFDEHPSFKDGGLVAVAAYENGTRFMQVTDQGKIHEQGFFIPLGGSTSAPHWAPGSDVVYAVDYERGVDVLKYSGNHYVPGVPEPNATPGTFDQGLRQSASTGATCRSDSGFKTAAVRPSGASHPGHTHAVTGPALNFAVSRRLKRPFEVTVVQQARGRRLTSNRLVARFRKRTGSFGWDGAGASDGYFTVRFAMRLPGGGLDVRRFALRRGGGRFQNLPAAYLRGSCGALRSFKLQRPVFGGTNKRALKITYSLGGGVDKVTVSALRGKRVIKRFQGTGTEAKKFYRLSLPVRGLPRGAKVRVRVTVRRAGSRQTSTLVSKRL